MTTQQFKEALHYATTYNLNLFYAPMLETFTKFCIDTKLRQAAFLAQIAHESGSLKYVREIASGAAYEGRKDLGNSEPGDGVRFKGRGLIQLTGRANYAKASTFFQIDFVNSPEFVETPKYAAMVSGWYWHTRKLNALADIKDFRKITKLINGGYNGYPDRVNHYNRALKAFGLISTP